MARLPLTEPHQASGPASETYEAIRRQLMPAVPQVFSAFGAVPALLSAVWEDYRTVMATGDLSRPVKELLALIVAEANTCTYGVDFHTIFLRALGFGAEETDDLTRQVRQDEHPEIDLVPLLDYARRLTSAPAQVAPEDYQALRTSGLHTSQLLEAVAVIGNANFLNRVACSLDLSPMGVPAFAENVPILRRGAQALAAFRARSDLTPVQSEHPATAYRVTEKEAQRLGVGPGVFMAMAPQAGWQEAQESLIVALRTVAGPPLHLRGALAAAVAHLLGLPSRRDRPDLPKALLQLTSDITLHAQFVTDEQINDVADAYGGHEAALGLVTLVAWLNYILRMEQALAPH